MLKLNPIAISVICAMAMAGCAGPMQKKEASQAPLIQPVLSANEGLTGERLYRLGRYFEGQSRYEPAINAYREAIRRDPLLVEAYTGLGMSLAALRRYEDAIRQFQAAIVLTPDAAHLHNNLGYAYLLSGATESAIKALEEARRLDPNNDRSRENLQVAQSKLASAAPAATTKSVSPALQTVSGPQPGTGLVEVAPQVFELRMASEQPKLKNIEAVIEAVPLSPLPKAKTPPVSLRRIRLEVSNGNGVLGLAKRVSERLVHAGLPTIRLTNQRPFDQQKTEVQYREGFAAEAESLAARLRQPVTLKATTDLARHIDVRLVLGKDLLSEVAVLVPGLRTDKTTVAAVQ